MSSATVLGHYELDIHWDLGIWSLAVLRRLFTFAAHRLQVPHTDFPRAPAVAAAADQPAPIRADRHAFDPAFMVAKGSQFFPGGEIKDLNFARVIEKSSAHGQQRVVRRN